jgi:dienelactone hydrolase
VVDVETGAVAPFGNGEAKMHTRLDPSPDGEFAIVEELLRPFSYEIPCGRFPKRVRVVNRFGETVREVADLPLADEIPIVHNSCRAGPRGINWRPDKPAELYWTEAQDGGDPRVEASPRDVTYVADMHDANGPAAAGVARFETDLRYGGVSWGADGLGILYESWYKTRTIRAWVVDTHGRADRPRRLLYDRDYEDSYDEPGSPLSRRMPDGTYLLAQIEGPLPEDGWKKPKEPKGGAEKEKNGKDVTPRLRPEPASSWFTGATLVTEGDGASDAGDKPFLDLLNLDTGETRRLWECSGTNALERPGSIISDAHGAPITMETLKILLSRETPSENPQYYSLELGGAEKLAPRRISDFPHPHPSLVDPPKRIMRYKRADGVDLNATLYTPPGYDAERDGPLPTLMWAYPREFNSAEAAGQLRDSPNRFTSISPMSPLVWLARGYAILEGPSLPIIGDADKGVEPNDTYIEQLVAGARAAVDEAARLGVCDPKRVAVGGHSYGAFMASNLLAHAPELFACAVARSGAYNRTLTPFGFQSEERTLWEAKETYQAMSPFMHANVIKKPILLIHGEEDTNSGTNVIQSERFFAALKGNGADARLVLLPHESHSTRGLESVMHVLAETSDFLDAHLKAGGTPKAKL